MTVLRSGPTRGYSDNWAKAFGKSKQSPKAAATGKAGKPAKKKTTKAKKLKKK